jgi:hypothetical protein
MDIKIEIDMDKVKQLPLETIEELDKARRGELSVTKLFDLYDEIIVGGARGRGLTLGDWKEVNVMVQKAITQAIAGEAFGGA